MNGMRNMKTYKQPTLDPYMGHDMSHSHMYQSLRHPGTYARVLELSQLCKHLYFLQQSMARSYLYNAEF